MAFLPITFVLVVIALALAFGVITCVPLFGHPSARGHSKTEAIGGVRSPPP